jgi:hypothetical protein
VGDLERQFLVHHDVDFYVVILASVVGSALVRVSSCPLCARWLGTRTVSTFVMRVSCVITR